MPGCQIFVAQDFDKVFPGQTMDFPSRLSCFSRETLCDHVGAEDQEFEVLAWSAPYVQRDRRSSAEL